jgi:hypothetical protein
MTCAILERPTKAKPEAKAKPETTTTIKSPFPYFGGKSKIAPLAWTRFGSDCRECVAWKARGGYGSQRSIANRKGVDNATRERIWFSPHCLPGPEAVPA